MTTKKLIEYVHQHHPHMGEAEILDRLNRWLVSVAKAFDLLESTWYQNLEKDKRYYDLDNGIQTVDKVFIDRVQVPRIEKPIIEDKDEPGGW
jgi:hypothetical protein